jgi:hypothetical protein
MTEAFDRLKTALADRHTIERELGSGGMATVYLDREAPAWGVSPFCLALP